MVSIDMFSVIMLSVIMLSVIMLSVTMLSVMAPYSFTMPVWQTNTTIFFNLVYQKLIKNVTLSTTKLSLMPSMLSVVMLSVIMLSVMAPYSLPCQSDRIILQIFYPWLPKINKNVTLSITILSLMTLNAECCYAECHGALFFTKPVWQFKTSKSEKLT